MYAFNKLSRFAKFAWIVLAFNILVILWGGFVSASGAGDGCGESWPLCAAAAERAATPIETFIELFHRATSGIALIMVVVMFFWARRVAPRRSAVRFGATGSLIFMLGEAAVGALIVLFGLVAHNYSLARAFTQPFHLINTYLLLGFLGLTAYWAAGGAPVRLRGNARLLQRLLPALVGLLVLGAFGTIASLASTIFPSATFLEGVQRDFAAESHYLLRLRVWHPIIATAVGVYLFWLLRTLRRPGSDPRIEQLGYYVLLLFGVQYALGGLTALLLTPIWLSLTHLLLSDLIWLGMVWLSVLALAALERLPAARPALATD